MVEEIKFKNKTFAMIITHHSKKKGLVFLQKIHLINKLDS